MVTMKEIAEKAGVSTTTVSNVLHGKTNKVSPEMIAKIQELLDENNYVPRFGLNALTNRKSKIIGIVINTPDFVERTPYERPFYGNAIGTLESMFRKEGYYIMTCSSKDMQEIMRMVLGWNVDGVICISTTKKYCQEIGRLVHKPVVSIDMNVTRMEEYKDSYNVTSRDVEAGKIMMRYLLERGSREVVYVGNVKTGADYLRYQGADMVYREHFGADRKLRFEILGKTYEERNALYKRLKQELGEHAALFFSTDLNAVEAIGYYERRNIRIPQDISIAGCDDDIYARLSTPRLTTMRVHSTQKVELAVEMMLKLLRGQKVQEKCMETEVVLIERESVR